MVLGDELPRDPLNQLSEHGGQRPVREQAAMRQVGAEPEGGLLGWLDRMLSRL